MKKTSQAGFKGSAAVLVAAMCVHSVLSSHALAQPAPGKSAVHAKEALKDFGDFVNQALKDWEVPGLAIGIVVDGEVVYAEGFGKRDLEKDLPVTPKTVFAIGSCTKAFTTFAMGTLVDEGKLDWDKPVVNFLPSFKLYDEYASSHITPRDLVTHRSGLPSHGHDRAWSLNPTPLPRKELVARLPYLKPNKELRETFQYNNMMFVIAGYLVGELTGGTWEQAVQARILDPLGMTQTNFSANDSQKTPDFALPYELKDDVVKKMAFFNSDNDRAIASKIPTPLNRRFNTESVDGRRDDEYHFMGRSQTDPHSCACQCGFKNLDAIALDNDGPAGSINSNVEDMTKWLMVQLGKGTFQGKKLIGESTLTDMHTPHIPTGSRPDPEEPEISPDSYGMGWKVLTYRGHYQVRHAGSGDGFIAGVSFFPNDGVGMVAFANMSETDLPDLVMRHAADRILGLETKDWNGKALAKWKAGRSAAKEGVKKKDTLRKPGTKPAHALAEYAGEYEHPGYGILKVETKGEQLAVTFNNVVTPFEHWHYEVFNGLENPGYPGYRTLENLRVQFSTNFKGDVDRVAAPLEEAVDEIIFTRRPDAKLSDPVYLERFAGVYEFDGQEVTIALQGNALTSANPARPLRWLVPDRGDEFNVKGIPGFSYRFASTSEGTMTAFLNTPSGVFEGKKKGN